MLKIFRFESPKPGPVFLLTGAVHGNEKCGTAAIGRLIMEIEAGIVSIEKGTLVCVPVCNPRAYAMNARQAEVNLNRVMAKHAKPEAYEHFLANELTSLIDSADILLDLHSYSSGVKPFLFLDQDTTENRSYAAALGIPDCITGWDALYADKKDKNAGDTTGYAASIGKQALLVECGQHDDPAAILHGYHAALGALAHFGMMGGGVCSSADLKIHRMTDVVFRDKEGSFAANWQHLDPVKKGDIIIRYDDGSTYAAPEDGVVIMPAPKAEAGTDWIYFGKVTA